MSIANHHIRANGGTIDVWSKPGEGSTFTVALPLAGTAGIMHHIRANGGTIDVWSKPGEGSTFTVALPLAGTAGIMDKEHER